VLAIIFSAYDLDISIRFANQNSVWAKFLENYGMIPGLIVILSGIFINYSILSRRTDLWSYIKKTIFFLAITGLLLYLVDVIVSNNSQKNFIEDHFIISLSTSLILSIAILIILQIKSPVQNLIAINYSKVVLGMALFGYVICIQLIKTFWGRVRFRELDALYSQFSSWYLPQGITGFDSFPSGHAAMGWMLLPIFILLTNKTKLTKYSVLALIIIWAVVLSLSRVAIGAHYASDVLFGSFVMIFTYLIFYIKYTTNQKVQR
jgi:membrane-associated phospholipid phosphatase